MRLLGLAAGIMLAALALLLAMVVRLADPSLALALIAYGAICAAMMLGLAGALQRDRGRR